MKRPLILQYLNLLHKHQNPSAKAVRNFMKKHVDDEVFVRRAMVIRGIFIMSQTLSESQASCATIL